MNERGPNVYGVGGIQSSDTPGSSTHARGASLLMDALPGMPSLDELLAGAENFTSNMKSTIYADFMGFVHAVDWSERWLLGLGAFHAFVWILAILTRNADEMQMVLLVAIRECN